MSRVIRSLFLAAALAAVGAAPASAQTPPCTPSAPVPNAVGCAFDIAQWALTSTGPAPGTTVRRTVEEAANTAAGHLPPCILPTGERCTFSSVDYAHGTLCDAGVDPSPVLWPCRTQ